MNLPHLMVVVQYKNNAASQIDNRTGQEAECCHSGYIVVMYQIFILYRKELVRKDKNGLPTFNNSRENQLRQKKRIFILQPLGGAKAKIMIRINIQFYSIILKKMENLSLITDAGLFSTLLTLLVNF